MKVVERIRQFPYGEYHPEYDHTILMFHQRYVPVNNGYMSNDSMPIMVVLVSGAIGDYAAYIAATDSMEFCRDYGDKISFKEACMYFPLDEDRYRP